jgi:hypothetical protein
MVVGLPLVYFHPRHSSKGQKVVLRHQHRQKPDWWVAEAACYRVLEKKGIGHLPSIKGRNHFSPSERTQHIQSSNTMKRIPEKQQSRQVSPLN